MSVEEKLIQKKKAVDFELKRILSHDESRLFQAMRYAVFSGGKRFRPLLCISSGECFGVNQEAILPFACALELIHNYSLIHDDLPSIDNDDFRRGKPSCHKVFGEGTAILAGDSLLTLAFEIIADASMGMSMCLKRQQILKDISQLAGNKGMIGGQGLDISASKEMITEEKFYELIIKKTGSLIVASVKVGAVLGNASPSELAAIVEFGRDIGFAFQIRDDILDYYEDKSGKRKKRINAVNIFGIEGSKERLKYFVENSIKVVDEMSMESEELRFLALKLLKLKE